jgi:lipopolysaccharide assembly outer membrane protein LptD (OstA)
VGDRQFKYQEKVLGDGSAVILNENGVIEAYDASGNPTTTCAPDDADWSVQAAVFDLAPKEPD